MVCNNYRDPPGSPLDVYRDQLVKWLDGRVDKSEVSFTCIVHTINQLQLVS